MKKNTIKVLAAALLFCVGISIPSASYAMDAPVAEQAEVPYSSEDGIQPYWNNTAIISANIVINGSTATVKASVDAKESYPIATEMSLQKKNGSSWTTVKTWLSWTTDYSYSRTESYALSSRGSYRAYATFNVGGEVTSVASGSKTY